MACKTAKPGDRNKVKGKTPSDKKDHEMKEKKMAKGKMKKGWS